MENKSMLHFKYIIFIFLFIFISNNTYSNELQKARNQFYELIRDSDTVSNHKYYSIPKRYRVRYNKEDTEHKIIVWTWKGKNTVNKKQLEETIYAVINKLSFIPTNTDIVNLILETIASESLRGIYVKQEGGPAKGLSQIEPATEKYVLNWLKKYHKDIYEEIIHFYDTSKSKKWNLTYNVPYGIALTIAIYFNKCGDNIKYYITTKDNRSKIWKQFYNTYLGKGTLEGYTNKIERYL